MRDAAEMLSAWSSPGIIFHLLRNRYDARTLEDELNHQSGLFGVSGISLDALSAKPARGQAVALRCRIAGCIRHRHQHRLTYQLRPPSERSHPTFRADPGAWFDAAPGRI
jgi:hypothetical protein